MSERVIILIHHNGEITNIVEGTTFYSQNPVGVTISSSSITLSVLTNKILRKLGFLNRKQITGIVYRMPAVFGPGVVRYTSFPVGSDEDVNLMFYCHSQCPGIQIIELFVTLEDINGSSEGSTPNPQSFGTDASARGSGSIPCPTPVAAASPSFDLYCQNENVGHENTEDMQDGRSLRQLTMEIAQPLMVNGPIAGVESFDHHGDEEDEPLQVPVDSDSGSEGSDGEAPPMTDNQPSEARPAMSDSQNHPRHYSYLNLDAMPQSIYAGGRGTAGNILYNAGEEELHIGQQFPNKDAVLFAVKNYSIRRSVEYKVLESD